MHKHKKNLSRNIGDLYSQSYCMQDPLLTRRGQLYDLYLEDKSNTKKIKSRIIIMLTEKQFNRNLSCSTLEFCENMKNAQFKTNY